MCSLGLENEYPKYSIQKVTSNEISSNDTCIKYVDMTFKII